MVQNYYISMGPLGYITDETCRITVLRGHTQIHIEVEIAQVKNTSFGQDLLQHLKLWKGRPWGKARDQPIFDLIYQCCLPVIQKLAPDVILPDLSLEAFLHSPTYNLQLVSGGIDEDMRIEGQDDVQHTTSFFTSPMRATDLPETYERIPRFQARDVRISPNLAEEETVDSIQGRVITADGIAMYFKPRMELREREFERELCVLSRVNEAGLTTRLRVPRLEGLVVSIEKNIIGLLMTMITSSDVGTHLRSPGLLERSDLHRKWEEQLTGIIQELHTHDIVWGDVHPMNIIIDESMNAWAIDFGGMNNRDFVDDENRETVEGDCQGISRIFKEWLPNSQRL